MLTQHSRIRTLSRGENNISIYEGDNSYFNEENKNNFFQEVSAMT